MYIECRIKPIQLVHVDMLTVLEKTKMFSRKIIFEAFFKFVGKKTPLISDRLQIWK
jgi:hypothetical protein